MVYIWYGIYGTSILYRMAYMVCMVMVCMVYGTAILTKLTYSGAPFAATLIKTRVSVKTLFTDYIEMNQVLCLI